jgi:hypothetical protein
MLYISKIYRIESEIHPNFLKIRPIQLGPNFFSKMNPKTLGGAALLVVLADNVRRGGGVRGGGEEAAS